MCSVVSCVEYCINNNELIFLKKVIYFLKSICQYDKKVGCAWPKCQEEYIMMQFKKYRRKIDCYQSPFYFMQSIEMICKDCVKHGIFSPTVFSAKVAQFMKGIKSNKHNNQFG